MHQEVVVRSDILAKFNKREKDFSSLQEYNDYLEMVESFIFNILNMVDVEETNEAIKRYIQDNEKNIRKNKELKSKEDQKVYMYVCVCICMYVYVCRWWKPSFLIYLV